MLNFLHSRANNQIFQFFAQLFTGGFYRADSALDHLSFRRNYHDFLLQKIFLPIIDEFYLAKKEKENIFK